MEITAKNTITKPELGTSNEALRAEIASLKRQIAHLLRDSNMMNEAALKGNLDVSIYVA